MLSHLKGREMGQQKESTEGNGKSQVWMKSNTDNNICIQNSFQRLAMKFNSKRALLSGAFTTRALHFFGTQCAKMFRQCKTPLRNGEAQGKELDFLPV
ncbi:hypothetical protein AVEN_96924-1 [Araneus ventricosus]|uniref:Uncharacterized protein n=1 Tax=Araneus ventricosus TaxID=182803 RepID=A0A4Y2LMB5_ARAVE|nr:hypothetical protein AVEN_96924-1 [Araneus ventricosus]